MKQYVNLQVFRDFRKVRFYTFQKETADETETALFFNKMKAVNGVADELNTCKFTYCFTYKSNFIKNLFSHLSIWHFFRCLKIAINLCFVFLAVQYLF